jgi:RNA polymerase sigma factor (TIGR02999 family)
MSEGITRLLDRWNTGDPQAMPELLSAVYGDLRRIADRVLAHERADHTLQPTALVHELYLQFTGLRAMQIDSRRHLYGAAANAMRRILVDHARRRNAHKRGGQAQRVMLDDVPDASLVADVNLDFERLDDALEALERTAPDKARVVSMRYFAGLSIEETAAVLEISPATVKRHWAVARAWLLRELSGPVSGPTAATDSRRSG